MSPVHFEGVNCVYAKDQPEYLPLPVRKESDGRVVSCWELTWKERLVAFLRGRLYIMVLTFNQPLQPILPALMPPGEE